MKLYKAFQRRSDGCWDWTETEDKATRPAGPCANGVCHHTTRQAAERHYYDNAITTRKRVRQGVAERCLECGHWTTEVLRIGGDSCKPVPICPECDCVQVIEKHFPFNMGMEFWAP